ncbi:hypothetical protein [Actinomadura coerulea]
MIRTITLLRYLSEPALSR